MAALILPKISPSTISGTSVISDSKALFGLWKITLCAAVDVALSAETDSILLTEMFGKIFAELDKLNNNFFRTIKKYDIETKAINTIY